MAEQKTLEAMTIEELEQRAYALTTERQMIREEALAVQAMLSKRVEEQQVSRLLGREVEVQTVTAKGIHSAESVGGLE